jgi:hypothetical protein
VIRGVHDPVAQSQSGTGAGEDFHTPATMILECATYNLLP